MLNEQWLYVQRGCTTGLTTRCIHDTAGDIVLDEDPATRPALREGHSGSPLFGPCLLWPNSRLSQLLLSSCTDFPWAEFHEI